jgi:large subunit ribosomal protein L23
MSEATYTAIKKPLVTEKTNLAREADNQFAFEVQMSANKVEIRRAVEKLFGVRVVDVRTSITRGKMKRMKRGYGKAPNWKKALVTLHPEDTIELFEGV